jgi:hypothetical protein
LKEADHVDIQNNTLIININENIQDSEYLMSNTIKDLLQYAFEKGANAVKLIVWQTGNNYCYQQIPTAIVSELDSVAGGHFQSFTIKVVSLPPYDNDHVRECNYRSCFSVPTALTLRIHGKNLLSIDVQVNDKGAIAFIETFKLLQEEGQLTEIFIKPIITWNDITHAAVRSLPRQEQHLLTFARKDLHSSPLRDKSPHSTMTRKNSGVDKTLITDSPAMTSNPIIFKETRFGTPTDLTQKESLNVGKGSITCKQAKEILSSYFKLKNGKFFSRYSQESLDICEALRASMNEKTTLADADKNRHGILHNYMVTQREKNKHRDFYKIV